MALTIEAPEAEAMARRLAALTGESMDEAVLNALQERLDRDERNSEAERLLRDVRAIADHLATLPVLDDRSPDEIIGYDEYGVPR